MKGLFLVYLRRKKPQEKNAPDYHNSAQKLKDLFAPIYASVGNFDLTECLYIFNHKTCQLNKINWSTVLIKRNLNNK